MSFPSHSNPANSNQAPPASAPPRPINALARSKAWIALCVLLLVALALRWPGMSESVWIDELYTSGLFCGPPLVLLKTLFSDIHPPAYFVFMHGWIAVFGDGEWALRTPPLIAGLASLLVVRDLGTRWFGPAVGWVAAWGLAVSPTHIWYSTEARPYAANLLLALLCVAAYVRLRERPGRPWRLLLWCGLLTVTAWSHYYLAAIPFGMLLWEGAERKAGWKGRAAAACVAVGLAVALVAFKAFASEVPTEKGYLRAFDWGEARQLFLVWFPTGNALQPIGSQGLWGAGGHAALPLLWGTLMVTGIGWGWKRNRVATLWTLALAAAIPVGLGALSAFGWSQAYIERSALPSMPFAYLLMAAGLVALTRRGRAARAGAYVGVGAVCVVVLVAFYQRSEHWTVYKPNPDWRAATARLQPHLPASGAPPAVLYSDYISPTALTYYDERIQEAKNFEFNAAKWQKAETRLARLPGVGTLLSQRVQDWRLAWQAHTAEVEAQTRMFVHELRFEPPDLKQPGGAHRWLLLYGAPSPRAQALLDDARIQKGEAQHVPGLTLIPIAW